MTRNEMIDEAVRRLKHVPLDETKLSVRAYRALKSQGANTVFDLGRLLLYRDGAIERWCPNVGPMTGKEIRAEFRRICEEQAA